MKKSLALISGFLTFSFTFAQETEEMIESVELSPETYTSSNTMIYYYIGGLVVFLILYFIVMKIVKNKQSSSLSREMESIAHLSENEKSLLWNELFDAKGVLPRFEVLLSGESIVGVRQCYPYQTLWGAVKDTAKTLWKQALWSAVGVKATYYDVGSYYLVLTDTTLHYLAFDEHDEVVVHEKFSLGEMRDVQLRVPSSKEMMMISNAWIECEVLSFDVAGQNMIFIYYLQNISFPGVGNSQFTSFYKHHYQAMILLEYSFKKALCDMVWFPYSATERMRK